MKKTTTVRKLRNVTVKTLQTEESCRRGCHWWWSSSEDEYLLDELNLDGNHLLLKNKTDHVVDHSCWKTCIMHHWCKNLRNFVFRSWKHWFHIYDLGTSWLPVILKPFHYTWEGAIDITWSLSIKRFLLATSVLVLLVS